MTRVPGCLPTIIPDNSAVGLVQMSDANGNVSWQPVTAPDLPAATSTTQGAVLLDATATDIKALGAQSAGTNTTTAPRADHVHPFTGTVQAAGITPITSGWTCFYTGGSANLLNTTSGFSTPMIAGSIYWAQLFIPVNITVSGVIFTTGSAAGTDKWIGVLYNSSGTLVGNSDTAGINVTASTSVKQKFTFTGGAGSGPVAVAGPGTYYIGIQSNGTTAKFLSFGNVTEGFVAGQASGSFGTVTSITPGTTYTADLGPFACTY